MQTPTQPESIAGTFTTTHQSPRPRRKQNTVPTSMQTRPNPRFPWLKTTSHPPCCVRPTEVNLGWEKGPLFARPLPWQTDATVQTTYHSNYYFVTPIPKGICGGCRLLQSLHCPNPTPSCVQPCHHCVLSPSHLSLKTSPEPSAHTNPTWQTVLLRPDWTPSFS